MHGQVPAVSVTLLLIAILQIQTVCATFAKTLSVLYAIMIKLHACTVLLVTTLTTNTFVSNVNRIVTSVLRLLLAFHAEKGMD